MGIGTQMLSVMLGTEEQKGETQTSRPMGAYKCPLLFSVKTLSTLGFYYKVTP